MVRDNASRMHVDNPIINTHVNAQSVQNIQEAIDSHWEYMPKQAKSFLLQALDIGFFELARFWSSPSVIEYTRGSINGRAGSVCDPSWCWAGSVCDASWFIAENYLKLGKVHEARILTLNGSFFLQCLVSIVAV